MEAAQNENKLNILIKHHEKIILYTASKHTGRFISKSDDEWSIALGAFVQAVKDYDLEKGSFLSFAKLIIQRRLIDYIRKKNKYRQEIHVNPVLFDSDTDEEEDPIRYAIRKKTLESQKQENLAYEIKGVNELLKEYGFTFFDLIKCSPKAKKTKTACGKVIIYCIKEPGIIKELKNSKLLPIKILEKNTKVPRKLIERHRKYIIAAIEILSGEYPELAEYLRYVKEEVR